MSDISLNITWFDILLFSPIIGWPGLLIGGALGAALFWKSRRILAGVIGALIGAVGWTLWQIFT